MNVILPKESSEVLFRIARIIRLEIERRCGDGVTRQHSKSPIIELAVEPGIGPESFVITDGAEGRIRIVGHDERGVLYGAGQLLRTSRYGPGVFTPSHWRGSSRPEKPIRGIYFATHFYNYYQNAPLDEVERYVEELALWGMNTLQVWYDMHHFNGFDDPDAVAFRLRLRRIMEAAKRVGMDIALLVIGNEAYANSPVELRALPGDGRGASYDMSVCPASSDGMGYILGILGKYFDWVGDLSPTYVTLWPYDQGGCACDKCRPWGSRGFVRCVDAVGELARRKLPGVKVIFSTWDFDAGEWQEAAPLLRKRPDMADSLMMENHVIPATFTSYPAPLEEGAALGKPVIGFPEISMEGMFPWGGFGANPQPQRFHDQWQANRVFLSGGFPYSEGLFEDMNKVLWIQLYWNPAASVQEILSHYIAYEFSPDAVEAVSGVIRTLERNHHFRWWPGELEGTDIPAGWFPSKGSVPQTDPGAEEAYATMQGVDATLPAWARLSWRWRILFLRSLLDSELKTNDGVPDANCLDAFDELNRIYRVNDQTLPYVRAPVARKNG